jgi:titin
VNLTNHLRRAFFAAVVTTTVVIGAAGTSQADTTAVTPMVSATPAASARVPVGAQLAAVTAPSAPRSPTAAPRNTVVRLTWLRPSSNGGAKINTYRVQRATSAKGPWKTIAKPTVRRYRATGLRNGTRYYFRIAAHNAAGWSAPSKVVRAVPRTVPSAPLSPMATPSNSSVKLAWLAPSSNGGTTIDKYQVQRATGTSGPWTTIATPTTPNYTAGGLANGARYYFRVAAHNTAGWSPPSKVVNAIPRTVPSAPVNPQAFPHNSSVLVYGHLPSSDGGAAIDNYEVARSTDQVNWTSAGTTTDGSLLVMGLTNGTTYHFRVRAHNPAGWGPWTTIVTATPLTVPSAPVGLWWFHNKIADVVELYWSSPASDGGAALDHYLVELSYDQTHWFTGAPHISETDLTIAANPQGAPYWRVKAHNDAGYSPASNVITISLP